MRRFESCKIAYQLRKLRVTCVFLALEAINLGSPNTLMHININTFFTETNMLVALQAGMIKTFFMFSR